MTAAVRDEPKITEAFRSGAGVGWHEHDHDLFEGCERFFRPGYHANLVQSWIPALDGVEAKLSAARASPTSAAGTAPRPDHGQGVSRARRSSASTTTTASIAARRARASSPGIALRGRVRRRTSPARGYDLVTIFDCLHDMGDPVGAARHVREALAADGTWLIVEPFAGDRVEDNLNPVGRVYYAVSTLVCTPASLSQEVGLALGAQAGEARLRDVVAAAGFTRFRRVAETPFNLVLEARP